MFRFIALTTLMALLLSACSAPRTVEEAAYHADWPAVTVFKSPYCGCCEGWIDYMEEAGFKVVVQDVEDMAPVKARYQIPAELQSCHTALVDGYVIEGHVPVDEVQRMLTERPDIIGLAVPGMPAGSPGMETAGTVADPFEVIAFDASGGRMVFASYPRKPRRPVTRCWSHQNLNDQSGAKCFDT